MKETLIHRLHLLKKNRKSRKLQWSKIGMDRAYFDYFHALALKGVGNSEDANELFYRIANENFLELEEL